MKYIAIPGFSWDVDVFHALTYSSIHRKSSFWVVCQNMDLWGLRQGKCYSELLSQWKTEFFPEKKLLSLELERSTLNFPLPNNWITISPFLISMMFISVKKIHQAVDYTKNTSSSNSSHVLLLRYIWKLAICFTFRSFGGTPFRAPSEETWSSTGGVSNILTRTGIFC